MNFYSTAFAPRGNFYKINELLNFGVITLYYYHINQSSLEIQRCSKASIKINVLFPVCRITMMSDSLLNRR